MLQALRLEVEAGKYYLYNVSRLLVTRRIKVVKATIASTLPSRYHSSLTVASGKRTPFIKLGSLGPESKVHAVPNQSHSYLFMKLTLTINHQYAFVLINPSKLTFGPRPDLEACL